MSKILGICPLCKRDMIEGPSVNEHHFIPRLKGGKGNDKKLIHKVCHDFLHRTFTETELAKFYNTPEKCLENETVKKYMKWLQKKDPEFMDSVKNSNRKKGKRR